MLEAAYNWIGLGLGTLLSLGGVDASVQFLGDTPRDYGDAAFGMVFAIFWAGVAVGSGYGLLHSRRLEASGGCLTIVAIVGGLVVLTAALLAGLSVDSVEPPDRLLVAIVFGVGAAMLIPSALLLWHRRDPSPAAASVRRWQGVVVGVLIVFIGGVVFLATLGDPYDVGMTGHISIAAVMLAGVAIVGVSSLLIWRARRST
ncbi:MAG TPA: hypothetical protein VFL29_05850 [Candidatus Dormibacteraeota bacterium]|nr:hypothetical protein [Candidatus Dormibacteraeota bacterium]